MADDAATRNRRARKHKRGDHSDCMPGRCADAPKPEPSESARGLVEWYRQQLADAGRLESAEGALVITLAESVAAGGHQASGLAALSRELRQAFEAAMRDAAEAGDTLDELAKRREQRQAGA